ncbi:MAG: CBS domain-containing protein [Clostridia bacterium]|nr:CBS domain-containing protein [Clostridia bacterium]
MQKSKSFFFSKILYKNIYNVSGAIIGKLNDLILDFDSEKPVIKAIEVKIGRELSYISSNSLEIGKDKREKYRVVLDSNNIKVESTDENDIFLARDLLDKQIVDINGKKAERVNDVRLGKISGRWNLIAVDIGFRGLLRRLGVEYPAIRISELFKLEFRNTLIVWDNVQPLTTSVENLKLSTSMGKLKTLHAADIADIIEDLDKKSREALFQSLDDETAAEVLEEVETEVQKSLLETLSDEKASDLLEIMPSDEAADILEEIDDTRAERLLTQMEAESSEEIRELMEYEEKTVGSLMSKDFISFLPDKHVNDVVDYFRENKSKDELAYYIYVVNNKGQLLGTLAPLDLVASEAGMKLYDIMTPVPKSLEDEDNIDKAMEVMQKYHLVAVPVVNEDRELIGVISLNDLVHEYVRLRRVAA